MIHRCRIPRIAVWIAAVFAAIALPYHALASPSPKYEEYFVKYSTAPTFFSQKIAPLLGVAKVGRSFALVAGVSKYSFGTLTAAGVDVDALADYLVNEEQFDEVVVLRDEHVNYQNLAYFLESYFRRRVERYPQSRFLFAYSGHGFLVGPEEGRLTLASATAIRDMTHSLGVDVLYRLIKRVVDKSHHTLVLLNACHAGSFLQKFGPEQHIPWRRGAHVMTAAGTSEPAYSIKKVGPGSVFYEVLLDGVRGGADVGEDGIVTYNELFGYVHKEVGKFTTKQVPRQADLRPGNDASAGSFFFLRPGAKLESPRVLEQTLGVGKFGDGLTIDKFYAQPPVVVRGRRTKLTWASSSGGKCTFSDNDVEYPAAGERTWRPMSTLDVDLVCSKEGRTVRKRLEVRVLAPPIIERFTATRSSMVRGDGINLEWASSNAEDCVLDNGIGTVALKGDVLVRPRTTTTFILRCSTQDVQKSANVRVEVREPTPRCRSDEELRGGECVDRCQEEDRWDGRRCVPRCDVNETWDGYGCVSDGRPEGTVVQGCGCWGIVRLGTRVPMEQCASGSAVVVACPGYCLGSGVQWRLRCR